MRSHGTNDQDTPATCRRFERSTEIGDLIGGRHQGQQQMLQRQAEHKTVPDRSFTKALANRAPSTQDKLRLD
jgi:hypothetical protein